MVGTSATWGAPGAGSYEGGGASSPAALAAASTACMPCGSSVAVVMAGSSGPG